MKNNISKYWVASLELMAKKPIVILPFIFIAFLEGVAIEFIYFASRWPLSVLAKPVIRKFFGEQFLHYPGNLLILPKLYYYAEVLLYVSASALLTAMAVNIFKNITEGLPVRPGVMFKNAVKRYFAYFAYGCLVTIILFFLNKGEMFLFSKAMARLSRFLPGPALTALSFGFMIFLFITTIIVYTFLISAIPLMVLGKKSLVKSLGLSIYIGARNFLNIFALIFMPFILYLPFTVLKSFTNNLVDKTFPEISLLITAAGVVMTIFVDCFMILSVSQWLLENRKESKITN